MSVRYLQAIRERELLGVIHEFRPGDRILELGAGSGWQSKILAERGFSVVAIDIPTSRLAAQRVWPVVEYDGVTIPFADQSFDIVFSSNVLEHIREIEPLQRELHRILAPQGRAVHIVPNFGWRFWTNLAHCCYVAKLGASVIVKRLSPASRRAALAGELGDARARTNTFRLIKEALVPTRHGELGNCLSELYYFSHLRWIRLFRRSGWRICQCYTNRLWYTGYQCLGNRLSLQARHQLSRVLGAVCRVYVLERTGGFEASPEPH